MRKFLPILIFVLLSSVSLAQEKVYLPMVYKQQFPSGFKDNGWFLIKPVASTNYVLNPSAETTGNFSALGGATVTRSTTYQKYGVYSYRVQTGANGDGISLTTGTLTNVGHYATVRVRGRLPVDTRFAAGVGIREPELIEEVDDNWSLYGASFLASEVNGHTAFRIYQIGNGIGDFYIDGIQLEALTYRTTYIDGSQDGCEWLGAENASISQRSGQSKAGGQIIDLLDEYGFRIDRITGAGASSVRINIDSYATLPGGEFNSRKVLSREFQIIGQFIADTEKDLRKNRQALRLEFESLNDQATKLWYTHSDVIKEISVHYTGGLEGDLAAFYGGWEPIEDSKWGFRETYTENAAVQVTAPNPYWQEVGESAILLDTEDSGTIHLVSVRSKSTGQWDLLGPPNASGTYLNVREIVEDDTYIYLGGDFQNFDNIASADYIVRYNKAEATWSALSTGLNGIVYAMAIAANGDLYVGGSFTNAGGDADADYLAVWDGSAFSAIGVPNTGAASITAIYDLEFDQNGLLYIAGDFTNLANIAAADYLATWSGSAYAAIGTGADNIARAIGVYADNTVIFGGQFTNVNGTSAVRLANWDGTTITALSTGVNSTVTDIKIVSSGLVYVCGAFTSAGGYGAAGIAAWNGTAFIALGAGLTGGTPQEMAYYNGNLYVVGGFNTAGNLSLNNARAARWNGSNWAHLDMNIGGTEGFSVYAGKVDPVIPTNFDLWFGSGNNSTVSFAGLVAVTNEGSAPAFPRIVFTRSGGTSATIKTLRNETTGKELLFDYDLQDGESLVVDLMPLDRQIYSKPSGQSKLDAMLVSSFGAWSLRSGSNNVTSFVDNTGATITAYLLWRDQYDGYD